MSLPNGTLNELKKYIFKKPFTQCDILPTNSSMLMVSAPIIFQLYDKCTSTIMIHDDLPSKKGNCTTISSVFTISSMGMGFWSFKRNDIDHAIAIVRSFQFFSCPLIGQTRRPNIISMEFRYKVCFQGCIFQIRVVIKCRISREFALTDADARQIFSKAR